VDPFGSTPEPKTTSALTAFRSQLNKILHTSQRAIEPNDRLEDLIPVKDRRQIWQDLQAAGFSLPSLGLSNRVL